jgi:hypothetical protein
MYSDFSFVSTINILYKDDILFVNNGLLILTESFKIKAVYKKHVIESAMKKHALILLFILKLKVQLKLLAEIDLERNFKINCFTKLYMLFQIHFF